MIALLLCIVGALAAFFVGRRSLPAGCLVVAAFGYGYGILRANLFTPYSHFILRRTIRRVACLTRFFTGLFESKDIPEDPRNHVPRPTDSPSARRLDTDFPLRVGGPQPARLRIGMCPRPEDQILTASATPERALPCRDRKAPGMLLHAGLDPALTGLDLAAEPGDVGLACLEDSPRARSHLRRRARSREQQDGTGSYHEHL